MKAVVGFNKVGFELVSCSRCGGSGRYSFNLMHGSQCYGCGGSGSVLSKRAAVARKAFYEGMERPVSELKVGDCVYGSGAAVISANRWMRVLSIEVKASGSLSIGFKGHGLDVGADHRLVSVVDMSVRDTRLAEAIVHMNSLNDLGKVKGPRVLAPVPKHPIIVRST